MFEIIGVFAGEAGLLGACSGYSDTVLGRFVEEIRTIGQLEHPSIVPIHDVGVDENGQYYYVMKYVEGETLESVFDKLAGGDAEYHKKYNFEYRTLLFREILRTIHYAHERGIIHRDIKPSNIMVGPQGEVMLMDWGLAKQIRQPGRPTTEPPSPQLERMLDAISQKSTSESLGTGASTSRMSQTVHGQIVGTPAYMSPEQARGDVDRVDERSDIYSLGAVWYQMLTLRHYLSPKEGKGLDEWVRSVLEELPVIPTVAAIYGPQGQPPHHLGKLAIKALAKDPRARYQTVAEIIDFINLHLEGIPACGYECPNTVLDLALGRFKQGVWHKNKVISWLAVPVSASALAIFSLYGIFEMVWNQHWWLLIPFFAMFLGYFHVACAIVVVGQARRAHKYNARLGFKPWPLMSPERNG